MAGEPDPKPARVDGFEPIPLRLVVRVGGARCRLDRLSQLERGQLIELDREVGQPFDLLAGPVVLARVEPVARDEGIAIKVVAVPEGGADVD